MLQDSVKRVSPFMWLGLMASILIGLSIVFDRYTYVDLWLLTLIYSVIGYALDAGFRPDRHPKLRVVFLTFSMIIYIFVFIFIRFIMLAEPSFPMMD